MIHFLQLRMKLKRGLAMEIHNIEQGTDKWRELRYGRLTASDFHIFMGSSSTRTNLIWKKAAERIT